MEQFLSTLNLMDESAFLCSVCVCVCGLWMGSCRPWGSILQCGSCEAAGLSLCVCVGHQAAFHMSLWVLQPWPQETHRVRRHKSARSRRLSLGWRNRSESPIDPLFSMKLGWVLWSTKTKIIKIEGHFYSINFYFSIKNNSNNFDSIILHYIILFFVYKKHLLGVQIILLMYRFYFLNMITKCK